MRKFIFILAISLLLPIVCCAQGRFEGYKKKAEQGNARSQYNLGLCYAIGEGVAKDYKQAVYWYRKAADQGNETAKWALRILEDKIRRQK